MKKNFTYKNFLCLKSILVFSLLIWLTPAFSQENSQDSIPENREETPIDIPLDNIQNNPNDGITDLGVAVSPSTLRFRAKPGTSETQTITVTNDTRRIEKFRITFLDFEIENSGKAATLPPNIQSEFGLSKWITVSPNYIELKPGEVRKVTVTIDVPNDDRAYKAAWCVMMVDQAKEKEILAPDADNETVAMGVVPVFGFGIYIFQNPPNVKINKVEIQNFTFNYDEENKYANITAKNMGDGIGFCTAYFEITNLSTGEVEKHKLRKFTIFPGNTREFNFQLPGPIKKGNYSVLAVLDFGSKEDIEAAEIEVIVP
jgi:hypothetical protein